MPLMTQLALCDTNISIYGIVWPKRLCWTLFQSSWPNQYNAAIENAIGISGCGCHCQQCQMTEKSCCIPFWSSWTNKGNGATDDVISVIWCQALHHMTNSHVASCFNHLDIAKNMVPFAMPLVSCDAHTGANSINMTEKNNVTPCFSCLHPVTKWCSWWYR